MTRLLSHAGLTLETQASVLKVTGDVSLNTAAELAAVGAKWLKTSGRRNIVLDFSGVLTASSVAISVLFEWLRICYRQTIDVEAIVLSEPLTRLASLAELDELVARPSDILGA